MSGQYVESGQGDSSFARSMMGSGWASTKPKMAEFIWYDGELTTSTQAPASLNDPAFRTGDAFTELRCFSTPRGPAILRLSEHIAMLLSDIKQLGVENFWFTSDELRDIVCRVVQINHLTECYLHLGLIQDDERPVLFVTAWESVPGVNREALENGIRLIVASVNRDLHKAAVKGQYEEAITIDSEGFVAEDGGENLLAVRNNTIYAPPLARILESLARDSVLALARDAGFSVAEERLSQDQLLGSDEVFVLGPAAELLPVRVIGHHPVGQGRTGPVTRKLQKLLSETIKGRNRRSTEWLDYMILDPVI